MPPRSSTITCSVMWSLLREDLMVADTVRTWVAGWAASRRTPPPVEKPWGFYIAVGDSPVEVGRHVLPETRESLAAASSSTSAGWRPGRLGSTARTAAPPRPPDSSRTGTAGRWCRWRRSPPSRPDAATPGASRSGSGPPGAAGAAVVRRRDTYRLRARRHPAARATGSVRPVSPTPCSGPWPSVKQRGPAADDWFTARKHRRFRRLHWWINQEAYRSFDLASTML